MCEGLIIISLHIIVLTWTVFHESRVICVWVMAHQLTIPENMYNVPYITTLINTNHRLMYSRATLKWQVYSLWAHNGCFTVCLTKTGESFTWILPRKFLDSWSCVFIMYLIDTNFCTFAISKVHGVIDTLVFAITHAQNAFRKLQRSWQT